MSIPNSEKKLLLIDGSSYLYRAFHALPELKNSTGQSTGTIYGVISMIKRCLVQENPYYAAIIFDSKIPSFRNALYEPYKAHRQAMPDLLAQQIEPLYQLIQALGLPLLSIDGVEADDVIGTLAKQAEAEEVKVVISTGDKDFAQLVNEHITLINTMTQARFDRDEVSKKFKIPPERIVDYLMLVGDASDNIPGVPQWGPKTAVQWLSLYGDLETLIKHKDTVKGRAGEELRAAIPQFNLFRQLLTIKTNVPLKVKFHEFIPSSPDIQKLIQLYKTLEFKSWFSELKDKAALPDSEVSVEYKTILTQAEFDTWLNRLNETDLFSVDLETTSLSYMNAEIVGISFSIAPHEAIYIPLAHHYAEVPIQLNREKILNSLKPLLENRDKKKVGQHIKYDMNVFYQHGIHLKGIAFDTMLESYVLDSTASRHDMDSLAKRYLNRDILSFEEVVGKGKKQLTFDRIPLEEATAYAAKDADITLQLHHTLWPKLSALPSLAKVFSEIEMPLIPILSKMETHGVLIDKPHLLNLSDQFEKKIQTLCVSIFNEAGQTFNIDSPKQLQAILFEKMGFPIFKKTGKGQASTAEPILQELANSYTLPRLIMEYRSYAKLKSTYTDKLPELINIKTGRIHTSYHQALTSTGRLSSSEPNLQNIPIRTEEGRWIRQAFIAPPGYRIVSADYSQIELRLMAHLSEDETLLTAFLKGEDIHQATAAEIFNLPLMGVTDEQRRQAKAINFGLIYGMSAFGLAKQLKISRHQAQLYIDIYFERYPGVKRYMESMRIKAKTYGFVETLFGRRLYLPAIHDRNRMIQQAAERAAINAPLQGTAADIIKIAMVALDNIFHQEKMDAVLLMQVHDELIFEVHETSLEKTKAIICREMNQAVSLRIPLVTNIGSGSNWEAAH